MNESTARNIRVQDRYDELMRIGRHGHYETMFQVVREEIESLRQQLAERDAEIERLKTVPMRYRRMAFNAQLQNENTQLCQQLAAALAACKLKDEAISDFLKQYPHMTKGYVLDALAIQPDDAALMAWLGEPIGEVKKHTGSLKDMAIIVWSGEQPAEGTKLYSSKELK